LRGDRIDEAIKYLTKVDPAVASDLINNGANGNTSSPAAANEPTANKAPEAKESGRKALIYICWSRAFRAKHDLERAERAAKQAIAISGQDGTPLSDASSALAEVCLEKGNLDAAIKNATSALQANLKSFRAYELLGQVSLKNRMYKDAIDQAEKALQLDPYFTDGYLLEGRAQAASNDLKGAYQTFQKAVNLYPGYVKAHEELLEVLRKLDKIAEAKQEESTIAQLKSRQ
jgi:tetratricopeptide (TPR) repeat protein